MPRLPRLSGHELIRILVQFGFIKSRQKGSYVVLIKKTKQGKLGPILESDITRMAGAEAKGCANLMRGLMAEEFKEAEKK